MKPPEPQTRGPARQDGPIHPDPARVCGRIDLHLRRGEWRLAAEALAAALEEAKRESLDTARTGPRSVVSLGVPLRVANMLEAHGVIWADDLARMTEPELLAIGHIGSVAVGQILVALQRHGYGSAIQTAHAISRR